ncbi:MAG: homoserine kinase [Eubacteriales bacterium]|jgi:homoserine kinase|nr:homoserine kinase [Eubacteriales bacterium]
MITVKVPATSANMGPGFDCIGIALGLYNTVSVEEIESGIKIDIPDETGRFLPKDGRNLVYRSMVEVFKAAGRKPKGVHIIQKNNIPVTRGLGSSSASIVGGIIAANALCGANMSQNDIVSMAARIEGHPDNTTPAIVGGMAIAVTNNCNTYYQKIPVDKSHLKFAVFIPNFILRTKKARSVLPSSIPHSDGVFNASRAALLTASVMAQNYGNLKVALEDRLHQHYRKGFIKGVDKIFKKAEESGALGSYISGAGPTIVSIVKTEDENKFLASMSQFLPQRLVDWSLIMLEVDNMGARLI